MSCPNCNLSLGWARADYKDPEAPWYKHTEQIVTCKYCGVRYKAEPKYLSLFILILMLGSFVYLEQGFVGWGKWVMGLLFGTGVVLGILEANRPYERID